MRRRCTSNRGFTLVELLVVIGIILILIAILLPVLSRVKQQAQETVCAANLFQLGHAMTMYTQQYKYFPGARLLTASHDEVQSWPVRLRRCLSNGQKAFYCPAADARCEWNREMGGAVEFSQELQTRFGYELGERLLLRGKDIFPNGPPADGTWFSYGYNEGGVGGGPGMMYGRGAGNPLYGPTGEIVPSPVAVSPASDMRRSSEFILLADSSSDGWEDFVIRPFNGTNFITSVGVLSDAIGKRHHGGANVLFGDGHVSWNLQSQLLVKWRPIREEAQRQRLWNLDNEPAGIW